MDLRQAARWPMRVLVLAGMVGCAAIDPQVGPSQESCGVDPIGAASTAGSGGYGSAPSAGSGGSSAVVATRYCSPDAGGPCDLCESTYCCTTRMACYMDPVCVCADHAMDECLGNGGSAPSPGQVAACEDAFSARGSVEQARITCLQAWCAAACAGP